MFEKFTEKAKRILFLARYEASQQGAKQILIMLCDDSQHGCKQCDHHADDAVPVTPPGGFLVG